MNALLGYGSSDSSSSDESDDEIKKIIKKEPDECQQASKLPKPDFGLSNQSSGHHSVFANPYVEAEQAKAAVLEKHVKMVAGQGKVDMINGKKICWMHRKGKCRFGHNCKYAHDTDVQKPSDDAANQNKGHNMQSRQSESSGSSVQGPPSSVPLDIVTSTSDELWEEKANINKLKRPGLSSGLVPSNKVMKIYKEQKKKDLK